MPDNFLIYTAENLRKINSQRRALSQPTITDVPILKPGQVSFTNASQMHDEPASCYNCIAFNYGKSCMKIGPETPIKKFSYPPKPTADAKVIEYWPCCSMHDYGEPNYGSEKFISHNDPDNVGLGWINAPKPGQKLGGANCGGCNGGDDCDNYITDGPGDKRQYPTAFCRVLQTPVEAGAVCSAWEDDDFVPWDKAMLLLKEIDAI